MQDVIITYIRRLKMEDRFNWHPYRGTDKHPKGGIDKFVEEYKPEIVHVCYQYWVRKPLCN